MTDGVVPVVVEDAAGGFFFAGFGFTAGFGGPTRITFGTAV